MDAAEYIDRYGAHLSDAEKRYIRAFGAPAVSDPGQAARRPATPSIGSAGVGEPEYLPGSAADLQHQLDEDEAAEAGALW